MAYISASIFVAAPPEIVWGVAQDIARRAQWDTRVVAVENMTGNQIGSGSKLRYHFAAAPGIHLWHEVDMVTFLPSKQSSIKLFAASSLSPYRIASGSWRFIPKDGGTLFSTTFQYKLKGGWIGALLDFMVNEWIVRRETEKSLRNLRTLAEHVYHAQKAPIGSS